MTADAARNEQIRRLITRTHYAEMLAQSLMQNAIAKAQQSARVTK